MLSSKFNGMRATGRVKLTLMRPSGTGGSYVDGRWVEAGASPVEIDANVQPLGYKETMLLEAADRSKRSLKVYSPDPIYSESENENGADEFDWQGDTFKVMKVENYEMGVLSHHKAVAIMKEKINEPV